MLNLNGSLIKMYNILKTEIEIAHSFKPTKL